MRRSDAIIVLAAIALLLVSRFLPALRQSGLSFTSTRATHYISWARLLPFIVLAALLLWSLRRISA